MKHTLFITAVLLIATVPLSAATYYASPNGTGDGRSYAKPTTFAKGLKLLGNPGDTLYLFSGQYDLLTTDVNNLVGSASKRIVISGYEGINRSGKYSAILDFRTTAYGKSGLQIKNTCSYLHVKNLTLRYSGKNNLINYGNYNLFENLDIYGSGDTGCQMKEGGNNIIKNVDSHDNFDYELDKSGNLTKCDFGGNADGFADKQFTGDGNHYIGCRAWNNSDDGWDFFERVSSSQTIIENCVCYKNGPAKYDMRNHPRYETDKAWFDQFASGRYVTDADGNTVYVTLEAYPNMGNGNGFKLGGKSTQHDALVHHCLAVANNIKGFDQNSDAGKLYLYNNTAYANGAGGGSDYAFYNDNGCKLYIQNCISYQSKGNNSFHKNIVQVNDHNTWSMNFSVAASDFQSRDTTLILAPRQGDGSLPNNDFMRLADGSSLIDAGIDVNLGYNGSAPDLGCFETDGEHHNPDPDPDPQPQPEGTHAIAFVTIPGCAEDKPLLTHLRQNDSLWIVETDATDTEVDYSEYEVIVIGPKPASSAAGFTPIKTLSKPKVLLKPWLLKQGVWSWGTAINTPDLSVTVSNTAHPLFRGLTISDGQIQLFSQCNTNAVTAISEWTLAGTIQTLGAPISAPTASAIAILPSDIIMIGISEYSSVYLTDNGKQLIENAILELLGINMPTGIDNFNVQSKNLKFIKDGQLYIQAGDAVYDITGCRINR